MENDRYNWLLQDVASRNQSTAALERVATAQERGTDATNLLRQAIQEKNAVDEELKREWINDQRRMGVEWTAAVTEIAKSLALLDRGVLDVKKEASGVVHYHRREGDDKVGLVKAIFDRFDRSGTVTKAIVFVLAMTFMLSGWLGHIWKAYRP